MASISEQDDREGTGIVPYGIRIQSDLMHSTRVRLEKGELAEDGHVLSPGIDTKNVSGVTRRMEIDERYKDECKKLANKDLDPTLQIQTELQSMIGDYESDYSARLRADIEEIGRAAGRGIIKSIGMVVTPFGAGGVFNAFAGYLGVSAETPDWVAAGSSNTVVKFVALTALSVAAGGVVEAMSKATTDAIQAVQLRRKITELRKEGARQMVQIKQEFRDAGFKIPPEAKPTGIRRFIPIAAKI